MNNPTDNSVKIIMERGKIWNIDELPEKSIAIDGSVMGPVIDNLNKKYSFDHHGNCIRHVSSATCVQVLDAILLDFNPDGYTIYINDVDGDTVLAAAILLKPELAKNNYVQDIVRTIGIIDSHGASYPLQEKAETDYKIFMNNVVDKVFQLKKEKKYGEADLEELLSHCINKFEQMVEGKFKDYQEQQEISPVYELIPETNSDWIMIKTSTYNIFNQLYTKGYKKIIVWDKMPDGSYSYSIAKKSEFIDFPVKDILSKLNEIEPGWGGGSTIGGSPRNLNGSRSNLEPQKIIEIVNQVLAN